MSLPNTAVFVLVLAAVGASVGSAGEPAIAVIVGDESAVGAVTVDTLRDLYLRRQRLWPDGRRALPVNLPADDPLRRRFSRRVLGRLPRELLGYWNRRYFEGIRPPMVLRSPEAIAAYLAAEPSAIGYVAADEADLPGCRVVMVLQAADR